MLPDRLAMSGEVNIYKVSLVDAPPKGFSTPQVYSPLPIKNPIFMKASRNIPSFPIEDIFNASEEPQKRHLKPNKVLRQRFNDLNLDSLVYKKKNGGDQKTSNSEKMSIVMDSEEDLMSLGSICPPSRVSNPQVFDEEFLKMDGVMIYESRVQFELIGKSRKTQHLAEQIA